MYALDPAEDTSLTIYHSPRLNDIHRPQLGRAATSVPFPRPHHRITMSDKTSLLSLPLEIRLQIYALLLSLPPYSKHSTHQPPVHAAILLANRLINFEATPLLYSNTFLAHPSLLSSFPRLRPSYAPVREASALRRIRRFHLVLRLDCDVPCSRHAFAAAFTGLDELVVDVVQAVFLGVGCANLRVLEGVRGVHRVTIRGSTTGFEDYIRWLEGVMMSEPGANVDDFEPSGSERVHHLNLAVWPQQATVEG